MSRRLEILQHALGLDQFGQGRSYRNHFVTGSGSTDWADCVMLAADGLMTQHRGNALAGGNDVFIVTPTGVEYVRENSPAPPVLSAAQKRYRAFLRDDSGMKFGEWLKARAVAAPGGAE